MMARLTLSCGCCFADGAYPLCAAPVFAEGASTCPLNADIDGTDVVNVQDLLGVLGAFGCSCDGGC